MYATIVMEETQTARADEKTMKPETEAIRDLLKSLIYHGRGRFSKSRDEIVIKKAIGFINHIFGTGPNVPSDEIILKKIRKNS